MWGHIGSQQLKKSRAISAVAAAVLALSGFPAAAAAAEAALDPVVVDRSVSANGRPITRPAGASEVVVKLPADAVAVLGEKGITSLSYDFYNGNSSPLPGLSGTASISSDDQTVTVPFPADFSGFSPGDLIYCEDTFNLCHNTVTHPYRGFQLVLAGHGPSGTPHIPFYGRAGLSPGTAAGPSPVTVDLGRGWVATYGTF